ncbi:hypothetical protein [Pseudomonas nitroreducens]|uniref:hypothetical protein n=1 Tax=Pseudomonas nitroreducens TaxID=46680 RepID=UPI00265A466C|nr:hypothetical protein [Pseudomonas nitroreducens]MCP1651699.1 hypothetical protein [Pseudomonas nitroreducens]MCP1684436.1 hypothetical protein [Pseudomonas nitroreducens]
MSGGGGGGKSTTTTEIPKELKPLATAYAGKAMDLANSPYQAYGGQQVAGLSGYQNQAANMIANRASSGDSTLNGIKNTMNAALYTGKAATANPYSGSNPYLQQNIDAAMSDITRNYNDAVAPGLTTQMVNSGSFGNTGAQASTANALNDLTKNLANTTAGMRMQDYTNQQNLAEQYAQRNDAAMSHMVDVAPTYANQAYTDAGQLMNAGQMYQNNNQQNLDAQYQNFLDSQNDPYKKLAAMAGVFGSGLGQQTTTKSSGGGK